MLEQSKGDQGAVERDESPKFEVGRWTEHKFEPYETAFTEKEAKAKLRKMTIDSPIPDPEQIRIFEKGGEQPRRDLEEAVGLEEK